MHATHVDALSTTTDQNYDWGMLKWHQSNLIAHHCNLKPKEFVHFIGDAHIYEEHMEVLKKQIDVLHLPLFPKLIIKNKFDDINNYKLEDFEIKKYKYLDKYKMKMRA